MHSDLEQRLRIGLRLSLQFDANPASQILGRILEFRPYGEVPFKEEKMVVDHLAPVGRYICFYPALKLPKYHIDYLRWDEATTAWKAICRAKLGAVDEVDGSVRILL